MLNLKVINLWGGPGTGKSTLAAGLFNLMKARGMSVELVTEFAKDLTYAKDFGSLRNQLLILARQDERLRRLEGQVEWVITDSPLPTGLAFITPEYERWLPDAIYAAYWRYQNYDVWVNRMPRPYQSWGRNETAEQARALDLTLAQVFEKATTGDEEYTTETDADEVAPYEVLEWLMQEGEA